MLVEIWKPQTPLPVNGYLYFRPEDENEVKVAISAKDKASPVPLTVQVKPNGEKHLGLIHAHIVGSSRNDTGWIGKTDFGIYEYPTRSILELSVEIVSGLRDYSSERVGTAALALEDLISKIPNSPTHSALRLASSYLADLTQQCSALLEHGSPFVHTQLGDTNKSWWLQMPSLLTIMRSKKHELPKKFGLEVPKGLVAVDTWLTNLLERLARLTTLTANVQRKDVLLEASAYCAALAERYFLRGNGALAVLFLHRSADLCLLSVCSKQHGIVDWTSHGGRFDRTVVRNPQDTSIVLRNSVDVVDSMNLLAPDPKRSSAFIELNGWRNLLVQTHYLSDICDSVVRNVFGNVRPHLENIGGADWKYARDCYLRGVRLNLSDFLDIDGSLTRTFEIVQLTEL